jgi:hypothetical protein
VLRISGGKFGAGLGEGPPGIMLEMPLGGDDMAQEIVELGRLVDQLLIEEAGIPVVKDIADIEDDGMGTQRLQPWRALKRRFVLLIT